MQRKGFLSSVTVLLGSCVASYAQIDLQPAVGRLARSYNHTHTSAGIDMPAANRALAGMTYSLWADNTYYRLAQATGTLTMDFTLAPPTDRPTATLRSVIVTARSADWSGNGRFHGEFTSNLSATPVRFYDEEGTFNDGDRFVRRDLADYASIEGITSLRLVFTSTYGGGAARDSLRLFCAHTNSIPLWTYLVASVYEDADSGAFEVPIPNPSFEGPDLSVVDPLPKDGWAPLPTPWVDEAAIKTYRIDRGGFTSFPHGSQAFNLKPGPAYLPLGPAEPRTDYTLTFWLGTRQGSSPHPVTVELRDAGTVFASQTFTTPAADTWSEQTLMGRTPENVVGELQLRVVRAAGTNSVSLDWLSLAAAPSPSPGTTILIR